MANMEKEREEKNNHESAEAENGDNSKLSRCFLSIKKKLENKEEGLAGLVEKLVSCLENKEYVIRECNVEILNQLKEFDFETMDEKHKKMAMSNLEKTIEDIEEFNKRAREIRRIRGYLGDQKEEIADLILAKVDYDDIRRDNMTETVDFIRNNIEKMIAKIKAAGFGVIKTSDLRDRLGVFETVYLGFMKKLVEKRKAMEKAEKDGDRKEHEIKRKKYLAAKKNYENVLNHEGKQFASYLRKCLEDDDFLAYEAGNSNTKIEKIQDFE